jgi:hypothetical protein
VYFTSPHFNPAIEQQAIARCWRIGQKKEVNVFRFITHYKETKKDSEIVVREHTMDTYSEKIQVKKQEILSIFEEEAMRTPMARQIIPPTYTQHQNQHQQKPPRIRDRRIILKKKDRLLKA